MIADFPTYKQNVSLSGSAIGSPAEISEMLELAHKEKIHGWVQKWDLNQVNEAIPAMEAGKARYRYVLVNQENGGKLDTKSQL